MKKLVCLLLLGMWAHRNPDHFVQFWGYIFGTALVLLQEIFNLALKTLEHTA
ncbi:MAG: hypothetical protein ACO394_05100 [Blastocatellia bacterium]